MILTNTYTYFTHHMNNTLDQFLDTVFDGESCAVPVMAWWEKAST